MGRTRAEASLELSSQPAANLLRHLAEEQSIHKPVDGHESLGLFVRTIDALGDVHHSHARELQALQYPQGVRKIARDAAAVVYEEHIEHARGSGRCDHEGLQASATIYTRTTDRRVGVDVRVLPDPAVTFSVTLGTLEVDPRETYRVEGRC